MQSDPAVPSDRISEPAFLLTELRYTLGQLHVQLADIPPDRRGEDGQGGQSVNQILQEMFDAEDGYQRKYAEILSLPLDVAEGEDAHVPLPVNEEEEIPDLHSQFEHRRAHTIATLEKVGASWPDDLVEAVRDQVNEDRRHTTAIAEYRKQLYAEPTRPDLQEPLTENPTPEQKSEETASEETSQPAP